MHWLNETDAQRALGTRPSDREGVRGLRSTSPSFPCNKKSEREREKREKKRENVSSVKTRNKRRKTVWRRARRLRWPLAVRICYVKWLNDPFQRVMWNECDFLKNMRSLSILSDYIRRRRDATLLDYSATFSFWISKEDCVKKKLSLRERRIFFGLLS